MRKVSAVRGVDGGTKRKSVFRFFLRCGFRIPLEKTIHLFISAGFGFDAEKRRCFFMRYTEAEKYIDSLKGRGIVPGLSNMEKLCEALGNPQNKVKTVHIAGTNGKGSTGAFISSILQSGGFNVCRYVSPAVENHREIYLYNSEMISEEDFAYCIETVKQAADALEKQGVFPTSFEVETAAAFVYFNLKRCGFAVVECGMGGELDATNVIKKPKCCVITSISRDHSAYLGNTLEEISSAKSGIIKKGSYVVSDIQEECVGNVISKKCAEISVPLKFVKKAEITAAGPDGVDFVYDGINFHSPLCGLYQPQNAALAIESVKTLGENISAAAIAEGIRNTVWKFRFEIRGKWIFDGAHNPNGAQKLSDTLREYFPNGKLVYVFGVFKDKDYDKIARITAPLAGRIYTVKPPSDRGLDAAALAETVKKYAECEVTPIELSDAVKICEKESCDAVVCFGSLSFLSFIGGVL